MAIPAGVQKIVLFGSAPGGEIWETGFWLQGGLPTSDGAAQAQAELIYGVLLSESDPPVIPALATSWVNAGGAIRGARCYSYNNGGSQATYAGEYTAPTATTGTAPGHLPNQVCAVVTLRTDQSGRSYRGRMYLPAFGAALSTTGGLFGQFDQTNCQTMVNDLAAAFQDLGASDAGTPVVVSPTRGVATLITSITMDTRADIQRRRANKQAAAVTVSAAV